MSDYPGRPPSQFDLETQRHNLRFQEILENLNTTLQHMSSANQNMEFNVKLDELLNRLVSQHGQDRHRINFEFQQIRDNMSRSAIGEAFHEQTSAQQRLMDLQNRVSASEAQLALYAPSEYVRPSQQTIFADASAAGMMRSEVQDTLSRGIYSAMGAGYYGPLMTHPYFDGLLPLGVESAFRGPGITPMQRALREHQHIRNIAESEDPVQMRRFMEYQRDMFEESQKATFNRHISGAMGVEGGYSLRGDFEAIISPGVSDLAEELGVSLDEAAHVVKKMRDLRVITQDVRSGSGAEIMNALDETSRVLGTVSRVIGSTDIQELVTAANQLTHIGGGVFDRGVRMTDQVTASITGPFSDPQYSVAHAAAMGQQYASMFGGNTLSAVQMGAWDFRTRNLLSQYATGKELDYLGGPEMASQIYLPHLAQRAAGIPAFLRHAGGGFDSLSGAEALSGEAAEDAVGFYMNMPRRLKEASEGQSGVLAEYNLMKEIELLQSRFGMSEEEAMLTVFGGDPTSVHAYREVLSARDSYAEEVQRRTGLARFTRVLSPHESIRLGDRRVYDYSREDVIAGGRGTGVMSQLGHDITSNLFRDFIQDVGLAIPTIEGGRIESYQGLMDIQRRDIDTLSVDRGFVTSLERDGDQVLPHIIQLLNTDGANEALERVVERIADLRGAFEFRDIQEILAAGARDYAYSGMVDARTSEQITRYIAELTPQKALRDLGARVPGDSMFARLLQVGVDPSQSSMLLTTTDQFLRANLAGAMREAGWDASDIEASLLAEHSVLRTTSKFLSENPLMSIGGSIAAGAGIKGGLALAGVALGTGLLPAIGVSIAAAGLVAATAWGVDAGTRYAGVMGGEAVDVEALRETLGVGDLSGYEVSLRTMVHAIRAMYSRIYGTTVLNYRRRVLELAGSVLRAYANAYAEHSRNLSEEEQRDGVIIPENRINAARDVLMSTLPRPTEPNGDDTLRTLIGSLLRNINSPNSEIGRFLRVRNSLNVVNTLVQDLEASAEDMGLSMWATIGASTGSMVNLIEGTDGDFSGLLEAIQTTDVSEQMEREFSALNDIITVRARDEEERTAATRIQDTVRQAYERGDFSLIQGLSTRDLDLSERALGKEYTEALRRMRGESEEVIRREIAPVMRARMGEAMSEMERRASASMQIIELFMDATDHFLHNDEMKHRVVELGKLLRGKT